MSTKVEIEAVAGEMKAKGAAPELIRAVIEALLAAQEPEEEKPPAVKKQYVVLVSDPTGFLKGVDMVAWVMQIPESESPATIQDRILRSAYDFNVTKRGRLHPVQTIGEAIENVKAAQFKENDVWVKTKTPVIVLRTDNEMPNTAGLFGDGERGCYRKITASEMKGAT